MGNDIRGIRQNLSQFARELGNQGIDAQFGVVDFEVTANIRTQMTKSVGAVEALQHRALAALRRVLKKEQYESESLL